MKYFSVESLDNSATELPEGTDLGEQADPQLPAPQEDESKFHEDLVTELENQPTAARLAEISDVVEEITEDLPALESEYTRLSNTILAIESLREDLAGVEDLELTEAEVARLETVDQFVTIQSVDSNEEELVERAVQGEAVLFPATESFKQTGGRALALETLDRTLKAALESQTNLRESNWQKLKLKAMTMLGMQEKWVRARTPIQVDKTKPAFTAEFNLKLGAAMGAGYKFDTLGDLTKYVQALTLQTKTEAEAWAKNLARLGQMPGFFKNLVSGEADITEVAKTFIAMAQEVASIKPALRKRDDVLLTLPYFSSTVGYVRMPEVKVDFNSADDVKAAVRDIKFGFEGSRAGAQVGGNNLSFQNVTAKDVEAFVKAVEEYIAASANAKRYASEYNNAVGSLRNISSAFVQVAGPTHIASGAAQYVSTAAAISHKLVFYVHGFEATVREQQFAAAVKLDKIARNLAR